MTRQHASRGRRALLGAGSLVLAGAYAVGPGTTVALAGTCTDVPGSGGLTAVRVVLTPQHVTGPVDASACDIGIYVGPGGDGTVIDGATVTGAHAEGVLVQGVHDVVLRDSTVTGSASAPAAGFGGHPPKAVMLVGTARALVEGNDIYGNFGGGVAVNDDGAVHPATLAAGTPAPAVGNVVRGNRFHDNPEGCAVVVGAYNAGQGVIGNVVERNLMTGTTGAFSAHGPDITSIVVAANTPNSLARDNRVLGNTVTESFLPGILVHANAPGALTDGTKIVNNRLSRTDWGRTDGPSSTVAVALATQAPGATIRDTHVDGNRIDAVEIGVWVSGAVSGTQVGGYGVNHADQQVVQAS